MIQERHPIKQGLKPEQGTLYHSQAIIQERHPIKQGLKPFSRRTPDDIDHKIQERHPIKQGLKRLDAAIVFEVPDSRATSNKTRIETEYELKHVSMAF